jgi:hypothetical protein
VGETVGTVLMAFFITPGQEKCQSPSIFMDRDWHFILIALIISAVKKLNFHRKDSQG